MIEHRPFDTLASHQRDWLKAKLHFNFAGLGNPDHPPFGALRVWNDDEFAPGSGFPLHPHRDLEIITYVRDGAITHEDSLGNKGRTAAGDVQVMSTGAGIRHSEINHEAIPARLFQIWIQARTSGGEPHWATKAFPRAERSGRFAVLASGDVGDGEALLINADARVLGTTLVAGQTVTHALNGRFAYLVPATGLIEVNGVRAAARDGIAADDESQLTITSLEDSEIVLVELTART
jgi:redox-sensitive bicupin YhaK (pirin superfamily)